MAGASVLTQERLRRSDFFDGAKLRHGDLKVESHIGQVFTLFRIAFRGALD